MNKTIIRKAAFSDIDSVFQIEQENIKAWTYNQFAEEIGRNFSKFIVAEEDGVLTGYAVAWIIADEIQLNSIAVKNSHKRNGTGRLLLNNLISKSNEEKIKTILIDVRSRNTEAVNFYLKNGFIEIGRRKKYYNDDDAILMEKKIR